MTIADTGIEDIYELTPMQQGMLFHSLVDPSGKLYVEQMSCEVRGEVPLDRWQVGWQRVLERHPILRTAFVWEGLDKPLQVVSRDVALPWQVEDLRGLSEPAQEERLDAFLAADREKGFRLDVAPLARCALFRLEDERVRFVWTYHHILIDGWCFSVVLREALEAIDGADALPPPPRPYRDYITWLHAQDAHAAETFWRRSLHGFREPTPLPLAEGHAAATSQEPHEVIRKLPQELTDRLVAFAKEQRLTLNNLVEGAWGLVLARAADADDVAFGVVISGRPPELEGSDAVVGLFINTVPLRVRLEDGMSTRAFLAAVQTQHHDVDAHGYSSLADIQSWAGTPHDRPLFETLMVFENFPIDRGCSTRAISDSATLLKLRGLELGAIETRGRTNYPVALVAVPGDTLQLSLLLDRGVYSEKTGERLLGLLETTLAAFLEKSELADIGLTGATARHALLDLGRNPRAYTVDTLVHDAIAAHARRAPNAIAIVDQSGQAHTYEALDRRAEHAAQALRALGVNGGDLVAVAIERSIDHVVALYAILKTGAAYLPLDPAYPRERLDFIVGDATPRALVIAGDDPINHPDLPRLDLKALVEPPGTSERHIPGSVDDIAYVIYTSGSTGNPKGVLVAHRNLLNLISWHTEAFGLTEHDRVTHGAGVAFDAAAWEIWSTLASGATLHIVPADLAAAPPELMRFLVEQQITVSFLATPVAEAALALEWPSDTSLRFMLTGGDRLHAYPPPHAPFQLVNNYGPTETTVVATSGVIAPAASGALPSIGRPIGNAQIYILDHAQRPVPAGAIGEIYIGGKGVALGYLNRPELTDERFVRDPFSGDEHARMYKSGDLGSFNPDGTIAFHGRRDRQVQVRGVRVEPGEIEAALASYAHVTGAAVVSEDQKQNGDVRLIAFVSCDTPVDVAALAAFLRTKLPPAYLPARIIAVDAVPMTPNGKVDYRELSARAKMIGSETEYIEPRTPHEEVLAGIWSAILGRDRVGTTDDFFEIGGHSLKAAQVVARAREAFGVELPFGLVFEHRTIAAFARAVAGEGRSVEAIPRVDLADEVPLAPGQASLWFIDALGGDASVYNVPLVLRLQGKLDTRAMTNVIELLVERHEALRTVFEEHSGKPVQKITPRAAQVLSIEPVERAELEQRLAEEVATPFSLAHGPVFRARLFEISNNEHVLVLNQHHIVIDAWSLTVLLRELCMAYASLVSGTEPVLPPLPIRFADWTAWQHDRLERGALDTGLAYWKRTLANAPESIALPFDRPRSDQLTFRGATRSLVLPAPIGRQLETLAQREGASLFMTVLAAFAAYLSRISGQEDMVIGSPAANRDRAEVEHIVGYFLNTLALRIDLSGDPTFSELVARVRKTALDAYAHQDVPFQRIVAELGADRRLAHNPLFQVMFTLIGQSGGVVELPSLEVELSSVDVQTSKFDLTLSAEPRQDALALSLEYSTDLFDDETIERMLGHVERVLTTVARDSSVRISELADIDLTDANERRALLELGRNPRAYTADTLVHEVIEEHARRAPTAIAIVDQSGKPHTYEALDRRAEQAAQALRALGVKGGDLVAVAIERSIDHVVALYAILKSGAAYLPLDPAYPRDRLDFIIGDAAPRALIIAGDDPIAHADLPRVDLNALVEETAASATADDRRRTTVDDLAYVIYTSGSTGNPKGVLVTHRNLLNLIAWYTEYFGLTEHDRTTHGASVAFDAAVGEIWPTLARGAVLHIIPANLGADPPALLRFLVERQITVGFVATPVAEVALTLEWPSDASLRFMLTGGDRLHAFPPPHLPFELVNNYGPTETTMVATAGVIAPAESGASAASGALPSIGRPIGNAQIYILDHAQRPVRMGVIGEIYIGGKGVARGYLNRPELTAERFVPDPFSGEPARMYKSGDLGSFSPDGTIAFHGRRDRQVQVRGVRVEPGEIEAALASYANVTGAAVVSEDQKQNGDVRLIAFVSCDAPVDVTALAAFLRTKLPLAWLPTRIVAVDALPMTPNGKVDYRELAARAKLAVSEREYVEPRTPHEEVLAGIWSAILGRDRIGTTDDFFAIGGHSLNAAQVVARAREAFGVELPLSLVFEHRTIAAFARAVAGEGRSVEVIPRVDLAGEVPLAPGQESLWFIDALGGDASAYNVPMVLRLRGKLDTLIMTKAIELLVERHEALRTVFEEHSGKPVQRITPRPAQVLSIEPVERAELEQRLAEEVSTPFSLAHGPIFRARLFEISNNEHVLVLNQHHIVIDAWSLTVLLRELCTVYASLVSGVDAVLPPLPIRFADWTAWQHDRLERGALDTGLAYWKHTLANAPESIALPFDRSRPEQQTFRGATRSVVLPAPVGRQLETLAQREGASLFMTVLAAFAAYLARISGQDDMVIGSPAANRDRAETEHIIGYFLNTLALRIDLSGDPTFSELVARVRKTALDAYAHQEVPFQRIVAQLGADRRLAHNPLFQVMFTIQGQSGGVIELPSLEAELSPVGGETAKFDLTLFAEPKDDALNLTLEYSTDLFDDDTAERMLGHLERVLTTVARDAAVRVSEIALFSPNEQRAIEAFNATSRPFSDRTVVELFAEQAAKTPEAIALEHHGETKTYRELEHDVRSLASRLVALGVGADVLVAISLERSIAAWTSVLAVLHAGGAYVPLDPGYPEERLRFMLEDSRARVLLTDTKHPDLASSDKVKRIDLDRLEHVADYDARELPRISPEHLAYVLYTSGSTGKPKGVAMPHRPLANLIEWQRDEIETGRTLQFAPMSFDVSFQEAFSTWCTGGTLVLVDEPVRRDPDSLVQLLDSARIERLFLPAVALHHVAQAAVYRGLDLPSLSTVITAGDQLRITEPIRTFFALAPRRLHNHYGPTESHVVTAHTLDGDPASWPGLPSIGRPIANSSVYVLDKHQRLAPIGVTGELYLAGACLARGYLWRPELTDERFRPVMLDVSVRAYKTGDVGRLRPDGTLEFFGRADDQVKVRGFRVEPGEIERALCAHTKVRDAAVIADGDPAREKRLIAYVVSDGVEPAELRAFLAADLPDYMVPSLFVSIDELPRTPSGKVDRRTLPAPKAISPRAIDGERTPAEDRVARIFGEVLGRDDIGLQDSFFDLGGHSLLAMQIVARLRDDFSVDLRVAELFENATVSTLTRALEAKQKLAGAFARTKIERAPVGAPIPLSFQQERLWFLDQLHPGSAAYNLPMALRLTGQLDVGLLEACLRQIIQRHRVLAQRFIESDGHVVMTPSASELGAFEVANVSDASPDTLKRLIDEEAARLFDLAAGPLIRARLFRISNEEHIVVTTLHHAVSDGWSTSVLVKELSALYVGQALPELEIDYLDYAFQQRLELSGEAFEQRLDAWRQRLSGVPEALNLPADRPRPPTPSLRGSYRTIALGDALSAKLDAFARGRGLTPFMVLLGAFTAYLSRITGADDIVVGTPTANRERPELEALIGFFINTLPMRVDLSGDPAFEELVARARSVALDAYALQDVPLERIVEAVQPERNQSHAPLFQVTLVLQNTPPSRLDLSGLTAEVIDLDIGAAKSDLALVLEQTPSGFTGALEYSTDLFDGDRIERMIVHLSTLLADALEHPEKRVSDLAVLPEEERAQIGSFEQGPRSATLDIPLLHQLVEAYAKTTPDAIALDYNGATLTYAELNARANKVAHRLIALGTQRGDLVALAVPRSFEMIVGLVGAWKAGTAYVPLDPAYPKARLDDILEDCGAKFMLVTRATERPETTLTTLRLDDALDGESSADPGLEIQPEDAAYVIYTSGSTGRPKGVVLEHRGLANVPGIQKHLFEVDASCAVLQFASINFDASVWEIALALGHGGRLVLVPSDTLLAADELRDVLIDRAITDAALPPTSLAALAQDRAYPALRRLISAGERCPASIVKKWATDDIHFFNGYGPTESTIAASIGRCDPDDPADPSIGSPVLNGETLVLDARGNRVPIGVPGELHLGGAGLARGYLHRDDLTRQKFIAHPHRGGARLYKSGDLARFRQDGRLEYLGRIDNQVKLRGFRIELGEIEAQIALLPDVQQAHVIVHARGSTSALVAYVVTKEGSEPLDAQRIREHVKARLPDYMVPTEVVFLDALPLTPNGKIDSRRLPAPDLSEDTALFVAPRTREEQMVAAIWAPLLGRESIGVHDHFFALGGHSLLAAQVISRVRKAFGIEIPLAAIFEHPTLEELAAEIAAREGGAVLPPIVHVDAEGDQPLSFAQERLRFLAELEGDSAAYNIPAAFRLLGRISVDALERSLARVVYRHDALSTTFPIVDGTQVARVVRSPFTLIVEDVTPEDCARRVAEEASRPFVLATGPVLRAHLFRVADEEHVLSIVMHHIVSDGWSMGVMLRELWALYAADVENKHLELPALPIQYADYAAWQRTWLDGQVLDRQLTHWKQALAGAPLALELPADRPRPPIQTHRGGGEKVELPRQVAHTLQAWSTENGATIYMTLLAAFGAYLGRISGQDDLILGSPFAGRRLAETEGLIGFFVNTLPIRVDLSGDPDFVSLVDRVRRQTLAAHENQDVPFEKLVEELRPERVLGASPIFQVMFALQQQQPEYPDRSQLRIEPVDAPTNTAKFDLTLTLAETDSGIEGGFEFDRDLFDAPRVATMARHFATFVARALEDPRQRISDIDFLDAVERARLMPRQPARPVSLPSVVETFAGIVRTMPHAIAVESEQGSLTYAALDERAERIASELASHGIGRDDFVAITIPRSLEAIAAILGVLKAGAVYLPIDPAYPKERIAFMLEDSAARAVVSADGLALRETPARVDRTDNGSSPLAYCIYTSGSTGQPKGVLIEHASLATQVRWEREAMEMHPEDRVLQIASLSFDVSVAEIFVALTSGATLVLPPPDVGADTERLARFMRDFKVTVTLPVPSLLAMLVDEPGFKEVTTLRRICPAGEALPSALVKKLHEVSRAEVWNLYGPTETTIYATAHRCLPEMVGTSGPTEPIGQAIAGMQAMVLDTRLRPIPDGVPGELYLAGATLARGYKDRTELTASRFIEHTFDNGVRLRMYKTGDVVRRNADGALVFMGRADRQVKLRGFRIELGEVEAAILRQEGLREAAATVIGTGSGARLTAFVTARGREHDSASLKKALERELPAYMVPGEIVWMESLPHSGSGKLDYRALESTAIATAKTRAKALPRYPLELTIVRVFEQVLDRPGVGVDESFFDLGGHSLLAHRLKLALEQSLGRTIALLTIFQNPTPERLANVMRTGAPASEPQPLVPLNPSAQVRLSLTTPESRPAVFVVPGGASTPFYFLALARELGDLDVFGLQPRGLDGEAPVHDSVEAYAAWYVDAILSVQPTGPYYLAGHSFGGLVAYEISQELRARGHEIALVGLFDTLAPTPESTRPAGVGWDTAQWLVRIAQTMQSFFNAKVDLELEELRAIEEEERFALAVARMQAGGLLPAGAQPSHVKGILNVTRAQASAGYQPGRTAPMPLVVFCATERDSDTLIDDVSLGWSALSSAPVIAHLVPGSHATLVREPHVTELAAILKQHLGA